MQAVGKILLRTYLSGNPQCKFGFNDSIQLREAGSKNGPYVCALRRETVLTRPVAAQDRGAPSWRSQVGRY